MAWIYLAESADSPSPWRPGSGPSPTVRSTATLSRFSFRVWRIRFFRQLRFGTMSQRYRALIGRGGSATATSSTVASRARTSALQEMERAWMANDPGSSLKSSDSFASADHGSYSWRTSQFSLFGGSTAFSWNSMRWGMMRDGQLFQPQRLEPRTFETEFGFWPTPTAQDAKNSTLPPSQSRRGSVPGVLLRSGEQPGGQLNPAFVEWLMGYPLEWTACADWAIAWFRPPRAKRSCASEVSNESRM